LEFPADRVIHRFPHAVVQPSFSLIVTSSCLIFLITCTSRRRLVVAIWHFRPGETSPSSRLQVPVSPLRPGRHHVVISWYLPIPRPGECSDSS
jgi:hypothetical protein